MHKNSIKSTHTSRCQNTPTQPYCPYKLITHQVDQHNHYHISQYNHHGSINSDNLLLRQYTNNVYKQYNIDNPFFKDKTPNQKKYYSQDKNNQNKKCIKLSKKSQKKLYLQNSSSSDFDMPPSKIQQIKNKHFLALGLSNNKNDYDEGTPIKNPISIKKSNMLKSTARTHLRNKSGLTAPSSTVQISEKNPHFSKLENINASRRIKGKPVKTANISISQFIVTYNQNRESQSNVSKNAIPSLTGVESKNSSKNNKVNSQSYCYCPICQQNLSQSKIQDHQIKCTELQKLYTFDQKQLQKYVNWKINQHLSSINSILSYPEFLTSQSTFEQKTNKNLFKTKMQQNNSINAIIQQCGEEVRKCLWFQVMRKKLSQSSQDIFTQ